MPLQIKSVLLLAKQQALHKYKFDMLVYTSATLH